MSNRVKFKGGINCYLFDSFLDNKYAGYSLKISSKYDYLHVDATNDDVWAVSA